MNRVTSVLIASGFVVVLSLPSWAQIKELPTQTVTVSGTVETANFLGGSTLLRVRTADGRSLLVRETHAGERPSRRPGDAVGLMWNDQDTVLLEG